jgi:hypothetical protein
VKAAVRAIRAALGAVFVAAGAGKLLAPDAGRIGPVLLGATSGPLAIAASAAEEAVPWLELLAGTATWIAAGRTLRHLLALALAALFVGVAVAMPEGVRCGCFGALLDLEDRRAHVAIAGGVALAVGALFALERKSMRESGLRPLRRKPAPEAT